MTMVSIRKQSPARGTAPAGGAPGKKRGQLKKHRWYVPLFFVGPVLVLQLVFLFLPLINTFVLAFTNADTVGGGVFIGLQNFTELASDGLFWASVGRTFLYMLCTVPVITGLSLLLAVLVNTSMRGSGIVRPILFSPMVMPMAVVALMFQYALKSDGLINQILQSLNVISAPIQFLNNSHLALFSIMLVTVWKSCGLYTLILLAALQNVSKELDEAAELDGASWFHRTVSITLPQINGTTVLIAILASVATLRVFTEPFVMTGGGPGDATTTIVLYLFQKGVSPGTDAGYASAVSLVLFTFVLLVSAVSWLLARRNRS
ncbi:carbohydrate ABC transporter permease [Arthrobacter sp. 4R501]|uniref:carbohydrate ABC transporter permease n=1 Tax=Arthrobacter sp. 4R501 TaxID=2058886 RepID=UPI000CE3BE0C|nr:sugar ABC transporter permease [Arthrobacter sp. 4R501]